MSTETSIEGKRRRWLTDSTLLTEVLPYMRHYAGKTVVIKYGGHAMGNDELADAFARNVVLLRQVGLRVIIVHGGGPQIGAMLTRLNIPSAFINGLRVTCAETAAVAEMVLGQIGKRLVESIQNAGGQAVGLSGKDGGLMRAKRLTRPARAADGGADPSADLGQVGDPEHIDPTLLETLIRAEFIPVIAPIAPGPDGQTYNINADTVAGAIAGATGAQRLLLLTDVAGVLDGKGVLIPRMDADHARALLASGVASGGMIPKLETSLRALEAGARAVVILDGRIAHGALLELFTDLGAGTLITADPGPA